MDVAGQSLIGRRSNNEDAFRLRPELGFFIVADGVGGNAGGEVASRLAANAMTSYVEQASPELRVEGQDSTERMRAAIDVAHSVVLQNAKGRLHNMGTTVAAVLLEEHSVVVGHVGDSRVYRLRGGNLDQLTIDHSFVQELLSSGAVAVGDALPRQLSSMVTRCLAPQADATPDIRRFDVETGDVFLLCTDGLTDVLSNVEIAHVLWCTPNAQRASAKLAALAYERGAHDNITAIVVRPN